MTISDAAALAASVTDPAVFAAIFDRHAASIHGFLARRVEPAEAESLLGEVFRVAFERRETFDLGRASARPWLHGIATTLIARHRRSEARRLRAMASLASMRVEFAEDAADVKRCVGHVDQHQWRGIGHANTCRTPPASPEVSRGGGLAARTSGVLTMPP